MRKVQAYAAIEKGAKLTSFGYELPEIAPDQVDIKIDYCGVCHSDLSMIDNEWGSAQYPLVPGHEIVGKVVGLGSEVKNLKIGDSVVAPVGAAIDDRFAGPVMLSGTIESIKEGDIHAETEMVVKVGSVHVIVTKKRKPYHKEVDFTSLGLDPRNTDIVVVKIGYLVPELYDMRGDWIMALTPGGVDQDLERLGYKNIIRPMYPLDKDMEEPDLKAKFVPVSGRAQ